MMKPRIRRCVDCSATFIQRSPNQVRCKFCQKIRRKKKDYEYWKRKQERMRKERKEKERTECMVINGHPQICKYMGSCFYGQEGKEGCSYAIEEGRTRLSQGLYIVDGKCPAYRKKKRGDVLKRQKMIIEQKDDRREVYRELTEV